MVTHDKGDPGDPAPTNLLPIAMGQIAANTDINNSFNVDSVVFSAGSYQITFEARSRS